MVYLNINPTGAKAATDSLKTWINSANQALSAMNKVAAQVTTLTAILILLLQQQLMLRKNYQNN